MTSHFLVCALPSEVPRDAHLLDLKRNQHINIVTAAAALAMIGNG